MPGGVLELAVVWPTCGPQGVPVDVARPPGWISGNYRVVFRCLTMLCRPLVDWWNGAISDGIAWNGLARVRGEPDICRGRSYVLEPQELAPSGFVSCSSW